MPQDVLRNGKGRKHCVDIGPVHLARKRHVTKGLAYQLLEFSHCLWLINSYIGYTGYVFFGLPMGICPCNDPRVTPHVVGHLVSAAPHYSLIFLGQPLKLWHCGAGDVYFSRKLLHLEHSFLSLYSARAVYIGIAPHSGGPTWCNEAGVDIFAPRQWLPRLLQMRGILM